MRVALLGLFPRAARTLCSIAVLCLLAVAVPAQAHGAEQTLTILFASHMADMQARAGKSTVAQLGTLLADLRAEHPDLLFFHGGSVLGPSALSSLDKGAHMIGILNLLEPVVMGTGRRDYMHKEDELFLRSREAVFPIVSSNIVDPLTGMQPPGLSRTLLIEEDGVVLGYAALVTPDLDITYIQDRVHAQGGYGLLPGLVGDLRAEGADFVIVSADFAPEDPARALAESGADILLVTDADQPQIILENGSLYAQQGPQRDALFITLTVTPAGGGKAPHVAVSTAESMPLTELDSDADVAAMVTSYTQALDSLMNIPVGVTSTPMDTTTRILRTEENAFGNLVADALREYYGAEISFVNAGGLRGNHSYPAGTVLTRRDLQSELPMHDTSCFMRIRGDVLREVLEHAVSQVESARGRFLQISGMMFSFDASAPAGSRVRNVMINGAPLNPTREYTVGLSTYIGQHGDDFTMLSGICLADAPRSTQEILEIVRVYIMNNSPVAPRIEGRITRQP